jgi:hypothetical protein
MIFGLTIFLSAFLLFQVQLIVAKHLLPWFGGAPAVWTTCQLFFQIALLAGYAYAHRLAGARSLRRQGRIHLTLMGAAIVAVAALALWSGTPLLAPEALRPNGTEQPAAWLLLVLLSTVGLPFFLLSTTGPLLQYWHSHTTDSLQRTYRLYALSNAGSLLGLLTYPFGIERLWDLQGQAQIWSVLFVVFTLACGIVAWRVMGLGTTTAPANDLLPPDSGPASEDLAAVPGRLRPWLWFLLSFSSSAMFLSTTNQLTIEVAAVPFLWVLPLAIYLLTFILCFDHPRWYSTRWYWILTAGATILILAVSALSSALAIYEQVIAYGVFLGLFCMVCHGELAKLRPGAAKLTKFYLLIAMGGATGGAFVGLGAPALFAGVWEFHVAVLVGWGVLALLGLADRKSVLHVGDRCQFALLMIPASIVALHFIIIWGKLSRTPWVIRYDWLVPVVGGVVLGAVISVALWPTRLAVSVVWPRLMVLSILLLGGQTLYARVQRSDVGSVFASRNFYGVVRVLVGRESATGPRIRQLLDGNTIHGVQVVDRNMSMVPTAYYSPSSGIAVASRHLVRAGGHQGNGENNGVHFGVLGMGAGTMAAFAQAGDRVRFYEFNPTITQIAVGPKAQFTFVGEGAGDVVVVEGDGRLSLEKELREGSPQQFDLLAMDAFSGDAVPVHLLTEEAFRVYAAHLRGENSILAINITNRHLDLEPVVAANARRLGFHGVRIDTKGDLPVRELSSWILLTRNAKLLENPKVVAASARPLRAREVSFTDRYSNLFRVLKR